MSEDTIHVAIAEDQRLFRECLVSLLNGFDRIQVGIEASNGKDLLDQLYSASPTPHVVLLDLTMPEMNGLDTTRQLKKSFPDIKIIILSVHSEERHIVHMVGEGVNGYLVKNSELSEVINAVKAVHQKGFYFNESVMRAIHSGMGNKHEKSYNPNSPLTAREKQILELICHEHTTQEIAEKLFVSVRTVDGHRNNLLEKTGARNTAGLVIYALRNDLFNFGW
ncbi:MAG: response regulator transcription factor [Deltaproteobacteria bacterium]|nr:response regulator transcription factor [Deltaproteobacteria bacterium]